MYHFPQIELTAGVVVEVRVSAVVSGGELWVQQPLHPSYSALHRLQTCMNLNYGDGSNTPPLPNPISGEWWKCVVSGECFQLCTHHDQTEKWMSMVFIVLYPQVKGTYGTMSE